MRDVEVRDGGAFGLAGGARGVEDHGHVVFGHAFVRRRREGTIGAGEKTALPRLGQGHHGERWHLLKRGPRAIGQLGVVQQQPGTGVGHHVGHFGPLQANVHRHGHRAQALDRIEQRHELGAVAHLQGHAVTRCNTQPVQAGGHARDLAIEFAVGPAVLAEHQGRAVAVGAHRRRETGKHVARTVLETPDDAVAKVTLTAPGQGVEGSGGHGPQAGTNTGTVTSPSVLRNATFTRWPIASASRSASTTLLISVRPSSSVT